jgi:hypothetical protein
MPKIDGQEIATKIFDRFIDAVRDYAQKMQELIIEGAKKGTEKLKGFAGIDIEKLTRESFDLDGDMVQPLQQIRDEMSRCKSSAKFESVVDSLITLFRNKVLAVTTYAYQQNQPLLDMWNQYFKTLGALAASINDYYIEHYFPAQKDLVDVKLKVNKGFMTPAPLAPVKVYYGSDCIQYAFTTNKGEWIFKLPKGQEFTFWVLKDGKEVSKSVFLSGNTKIKL